MTPDSGTDVPRPGVIDRAGPELHISAPPDAPLHAWQRIRDELIRFCLGREDGERTVRVPIEYADTLDDALTNPWPAGRWRWRWAPAAQAALDRATTNAADLTRALTTPAINDRGLDLERALAAAGFTRQLLPAQRGAVSQLFRAGSGGNFSVPGSGKTTMTYAVWSALRANDPATKMLVLAPLSAHEAWQQEAHDCFAPQRRPTLELAPVAPRPSTDVVVMNYERAAKGAVRAAIDAWAHSGQLMVVFDEAHRVKRGERGVHGAGARDLATLASHRLVLTGTPMPNGPGDLAAILDLAWPGRGAALASPPLTPQANHSWVRITTADLELEPIAFEVETLELDPAHRRIYDGIARAGADAISEMAHHPDVAARSALGLIAAAANPALVAPGRASELQWPSTVPSQRAMRELLADIGGSVLPAKMLAVARHARECAAQGHKLLVWTNFVANVVELERLLAPYEPAVVMGSVPARDLNAPTDRVRQLRRFREDSRCSVLIATPQTLGEGVSLHRTCQRQIHLDRTYNAGLYLQALERTHRIGMPSGRRAHATILVAAGTIDEAVGRSLTRKIAAMTALFDAPDIRAGKLPATGDDTPRSDLDAVTPSQQLDESDIAALVAHLRAH